MSWKRPKSLPIGQVWSRFQGRQRDGQPAKMYQIRDLEEGYRKQCLDMMQETFLRDEPLCAVLGIPSDPPSIVTIRANWEKYLDQGVSLACFTEVDGRPDELVAFNIIVVRTKDEEEEDIENVVGESWKKLLKTLVTAEKLVDVYSIYGVDKYLSSSGLTVLPACRGQNIGARMMAAREPLCKALDIHAVCTVFTAITSQVLAAKTGFEVLAELPYSKMAEQGVDLSASETKSAKVMGYKYNF
ncbi:unnamed protein product [Diatraea saccharalis]|uniref:N-acetyltransferase domain-containing protein n=1 Tax=Diatraea saccharalis TaxID=40085 RepID=A0A9N9RDM1_9NEOP|nr:unnamed protein product [Diatraea saccharalis]